MLSFYVASLWPAGHLPHKGGDHAFIEAGSYSPGSQNRAGVRHRVISPLVGEMAGRPEEGAKERLLLENLASENCADGN